MGSTLNLIVLVLVIVNRFRVEDENDHEYDLRILRNVERGTSEPLRFFNQRVFNGLHPLGGVRHFEGRGVFLVLII